MELLPSRDFHEIPSFWVACGTGVWGWEGDMGLVQVRSQDERFCKAVAQSTDRCRDTTGKGCAVWVRRLL